MGLFSASSSWNSETRTQDLYSLYEPEVVYSTIPVGTLDYNYKLLSFMKVGAQVSAANIQRITTYRMENKLGRSDDMHLLYFLPQVKFCPPSPRHFRPYAKIAFGARFNLSPDDLAPESINPVTFAWDITPFGFEWGGNFVYGNAELCWGNVVRGVRLGIGFRF